MRTQHHHLALPARDDCEAHRIFYRDYGNENATRTVVCVHGLMRNGDDFDALARVLASKGMRVIVPDMAGRGNSDWLSNTASYNYFTYAEDCKQLLQNFHLRQVDWVGTSMGGIIGMLIASENNTHKPLIKQLVLNDIGTFLPKEALKRIYHYVSEMPKHFATRADAEHFIRTNYTSFGITESEHWNHFIDRTIEPDNAGGMRLRCDPAIIEPIKRDSENFTKVHDINLAEIWAPISIPTLIVRGADSDLLLPHTVTAMKSTNINARSLEFAGCGHAPTLETPEQIVAICDFMCEQRGRFQISF